MLSYLQHLLVEPKTKLANVLHLGAGRFSEWTTIAPMSPEKVVLVDAHRPYCDKLSKKFKAIANVSVLNLLVKTDDSTSNEFNHCNNPRYSSSLLPSKIIDFLPNLAVTEQTKISETKSLNSIINELNFSACEPESSFVNLLIIETLGVESDVLADTSYEYLSKFDVIAVRSNDEQMYENGSKANEVISTLTNKCFDCVYRGEPDNGFVELVFKKNSHYIKALEQLKILQQEIVDSDSKLKSEQQNNIAKQQHIAELQQAQEEYQNIVTEEFGRISAEVSHIENDLNQKQIQSADLTIEKEKLQKQNCQIQDKHQQDVEMLQQKLSDINQTAEQQKQQHKDERVMLQNQLKKITNQKGVLQAEFDQFKASNQQLLESIELENLQLQARTSELESQVQHVTTKHEALQVELDQFTATNNQLLKSSKTASAQLQEQLSEQANKLKQAKTQYEALVVEHTELKQSNNQLLESSKTATTQLQAQVSEQANKLKQAKTQYEALVVEHTELKQSNSQLLDYSEAEKAQLESKLTELETLEGNLRSEIANLTTANQQLTNQFNDAQQQCSELSTKLDEQTHWHHENKKWAEALVVQVEDGKRQLQERQRSADLGLKLQAKAQIDLDDLRQKYQQKHHNEQQLVDLVRELRIKLQQAANYYQQLQLQSSEFADEVVDVNKATKSERLLSPSAEPIESEQNNSGLVDNIENDKNVNRKSVKTKSKKRSNKSKLEAK
ncbi:coiled-coil domain-containing protein [Shewanella goraebulensis]|uniref:hypothetical protein n=1 Tax=Shewanella goraebulensis TaxID=3050637 RepID=UPI00254E4515|nr:hypothetical protein [Shewanella goraebulensis]